MFRDSADFFNIDREGKKRRHDEFIKNRDAGTLKETGLFGELNKLRNASALTQNALKEARESQDIQKRRIGEKQIRALRGHYRPASILGTNTSSEADISDKLGG